MREDRDWENGDREKEEESEGCCCGPVVPCLLG